MWSGARWEVRDLGSRNGTFVGGERLQAGHSRPLGKGDAVAFGDPAVTWRLVEDGPPGPLAVAVGADDWVVGQGGLLALPDTEEPEALLYRGPRGAWVVERQDDAPMVVRDGEVIRASGRGWRVSLPSALEGTTTLGGAMTLATVQLELAVSRDEEHVAVSVLHRGTRSALELREHWYVILTLARARLEDASAPLAEQGWVDRDALLRMLGVDANGLNVAIYRARRQLTSAGIDGAAGIVEVRRGQRRFGIEPDRYRVL